MPRFFRTIGRKLGKLGKGKGKTKSGRGTATAITVESLPSTSGPMPDYGWISILIEPASAREAVQWRVSGQTIWRYHGVEVQVEVGNYVIEM